MTDLSFADAIVPDNASSAIIRKPKLESVLSGIKVYPTELYFGSLVVGEDQLIRTFQVTNIGKKGLRIVSVEIEADDDEFTLEGSPPDIMLPGDSFSMGVKYASTSLGLHVANVLIQTNEREQPYVVNLSGRVISSTLIEDMYEDFSAMVLEESIARANGDMAEAMHRLTLEAELKDEITAKVLLEQTARVTADSALAQTIEDLEVSLTGQIDGMEGQWQADIEIEKTARIAGDEAEASLREALGASLTTDIQSVQANVETETTARVNADSALASSITDLEASFDTDLASVNAAITAEATARSDEDEALASSITSLNASLSSDIADVDARVDTEITARTNADTALATRATNLETTVNSGTDGNLALKARIASEETARANGDAAEASARTTLESTLRNEMTQAGRTIFNEDFNDGAGYWVDYFQYSKAQLITANDITNYPGASIVQVAGIGAVLQGNAIYRPFSERGHRPFVKGQQIKVRIRTRLTTDVNTGSHQHHIWMAFHKADGSYGGYSTIATWTGLLVANGWVTREYVFDPMAIKEAGTAPITGGTWLDATEWRLMTSLNGGPSGQGAVQQIQWITCDDVSQIEEAKALITDEATTRATADGALATRTTTLETNVNSPTTGLAKAHSLISDETTARTSADSALASRSTALESTVNNGTTGVAALNTRLTTEQTTRANADTALSTDITNLTSTVNGHTATLSTQAGTIAGINGKLAAYWKVDAVAGGRASLKVWADANGGGGVNIIGDVLIDGNLLVTGSVPTGVIANSAISKMDYVTFSGKSTYSISYVDVASLTITPTSINSVYLVIFSVDAEGHLTASGQPANYRPQNLTVVNGPASMTGDLVATIDPTNTYSAPTTYMGILTGLTAARTLTLRHRAVGTYNPIAQINSGILAALELKK